MTQIAYVKHWRSSNLFFSLISKTMRGESTYLPIGMYHFDKKTQNPIRLSQIEIDNITSKRIMRSDKLIYNQYNNNLS